MDHRAGAAATLSPPEGSPPPGSPDVPPSGGLRADVLDAVVRMGGLGVFHLGVQAGVLQWDDLHWNDQLHEINGSQPGATTHTSLRLALQAVHLDDRRPLGDMLERAARGEQGACDYRIVRVDGSRGVVRMRVWRLAFADGERVVGIIDDVSEARSLASEARTSHALSAAVLDGLPDAVLVTDRDGRVLQTNRRLADVLDATVGGSVDEVMRSSCRAGVADQADLERVLDGLRHGFPPAGTVELVLPGGLTGAAGTPADRVVELRSTLVDGTDGEGGTVLTVFTDVTARRAAEAELLHNQKLQVVGQLASGVAHEINTPMQFIGDNLGFIDDSITTLCDPDLVAASDPQELEYLREELPEAVRQARRGVDRVNEIVKAMKAFGHRDDSHQQETDLDELIRHTLVVVRNETKYVADVRTHLTVGAPVRCYPGDLGQVFVNLVVNAAHAIADHGSSSGSDRGVITVRSWRDADTVVVEVEDDGGGIPAHVRDRIFEPFFTTKEIGRGTGQGLPISRSVVEERHGGTLAFRVLDDVGTVFRVQLPIAGRPDGHGAEPGGIT